MRKIRIRKRNHSNSRASHCQFCKVQLTALVIMTCIACGVSSTRTSKLYPPSKDEAGGLRVTQVMALATREEILRLGAGLQELLASGLKDSDLKDGSLAMGRVYCCHRSTEEGTALWFYIPPDVPVNVGDVVIIRMGRQPTKADSGAVNVATEVREKQGAPDSKCSWDPPNNTLWRRLLYCTWMPAEGWALKKGFWNTWFKPASDAQPQ
jgi:hypothetical protein